MIGVIGSSSLELCRRSPSVVRLGLLPIPMPPGAVEICNPSKAA